MYTFSHSKAQQEIFEEEKIGITWPLLVKISQAFESGGGANEEVEKERSNEYEKIDKMKIMSSLKFIKRFVLTYVGVDTINVSTMLVIMNY